MKTFFIKTFGCQMNKSDSERIATVLLSSGLDKAKSDEMTDVLVINSCSVRLSAENRVLFLLDKCKKKKIFTVLTGCCATKDKLKFKELADVVLDIRNLRDLPKLIKNILPCPWQGSRKKIKTTTPAPSHEGGVNMGGLESDIDYFKINPKYSSVFHAYVPIMTGCDNFCSYCVVPYARGREISRPVGEILAEIKVLINKGYKAITLIGQNVNSYCGVGANCSSPLRFPDLLKMINNLPGDFWIWFLTSHPKDMSLKLIKTIKKCEKVCHYIHLPVQAGNNDILKAMNRKYTREHYIKLVNLIRKNIPDVCLSTDTIVGFPGETRAQLKDTLNLFKQIKFDMAYLACYSKRPGTAAAKLQDNVRDFEKKKREHQLFNILEKTALEKNKKYLGKTVEILVEKPGLGKTRTFKTVKFDNLDANLMGQIIQVKIIKATAWGLEGKRILSKLIVVLGPTASGKSSFGIKLAKKFDGEIISADSRQIYKEMNIGTAKLKCQNSKRKTKTKNLKLNDFVICEGIRHYMIDIIKLDKNFTVAEFKERAEEIIDDILKRKKTPILVGGTGLYIQSIVDNLFIPKVPPDFKLRDKLEKKDLTDLWEQLIKLDPKAKEIVQKENKRRVIRALEVCLKTGLTFSELQKKGPAKYDILQIGIKVEREKLYKRIDKRVDKMIKDGLIKEVKKLAKKYSFNLPAMSGIGYGEFKEKLKSKKLKNYELKEIIQNIKYHTHQYAKRQKSWFKRDKRIVWVKKYKETEKLTKNFLK